MTSSRLSCQRIEAAASCIDPLFLNTPQIVCEPLSRELGVQVILKIETLNPIRSFKGRGTDYFVRCLDDHSPLVTASAGNFGQGLAFAAQRSGIPLTVFTAENANPLKLDRMRDLGATVVLAGVDFDEAKILARDHAHRSDMHYVEDGREPAISEGAGTIALELTRWPRNFDAIVAPLGNGALINGIGTWMRNHSPSTRVVGVCASGAPSMERSWRVHRIEQTALADTIADGIAVRVPVPEALEDMRDTVDEILLVDDASIIAAMRMILHHAGILAEPAGAAGLAGLLANRGLFAGQLVAIPVCGGNVTREQFRQWF